MLTQKERQNYRLISDKDYPKLLKKIGSDAPKQLYYKGSWDEGIFKNCLAVVGSRRLTSYGKQVAERLVTEAAAAGITIVSGFMYGGDAVAHKAALRAGGRTVAVMPCGIDLIHPEYQEDLYNEILENKSLIISEYEGDMLPTNWTYPRRNRIVAGLSKAVLVVEAGLKSGSLITANFAKKFGRKVFAVPGPITSEVSKGTLQLIKNGAEMAISSQDILGHYRMKGQAVLWPKEIGGDGLEGKILERLRLEPMGADDLARAFGISASELGVTLSMMELRGLVRREDTKYHPNY
ncbi:MAG: DNA-protecting protein DprA [Candidatus Nealsonbacteria bacterium]|nr:DNA-protecting protein DprA [Candidatus Nealsonbacteria bacterium]